MIYGGHNFKAEEVRVGLGKRFSSYYRDENSSIIATVRISSIPGSNTKELYVLDLAAAVLRKAR